MALADTLREISRSSDLQFDLFYDSVVKELLAIASRGDCKYTFVYWAGSLGYENQNRLEKKLEAEGCDVYINYADRHITLEVSWL